MTMTIRHDNIMKYVRTIASSGIAPTYKYMWFDEGLKFIVDAHHITLLPSKYHILYSKNESYIHFDPEKKKVMYVAWDIGPAPKSMRIMEVDGNMAWDEVEYCLYNFLVLKLREIIGDKCGTEELTPPRATTLEAPTLVSTAVMKLPCSQAYYGVGVCSCGKCKTPKSSNRNPFGY